MATNKKIKQKQEQQKQRDQQSNSKFSQFHGNFVAMKLRQGFNYQKPGV